MKIEFQRKVDYILGNSICRVLSLWNYLKPIDSVLVKPRNILVILLSEMGSLVLAQPMFALIKRKYPEASLHVLVFKQNAEVIQLLGSIQHEHIFTIRNSSFYEFLFDSIRVLYQLRKIRIDTVIDCELFSRISSIYSYLSGAKARVGFHAHTQEGLYRGDFINYPVPYNPYYHISQQFITLVESLESDNIPKVKRELLNRLLLLEPVHVSETEINCMKEKFFRDFPQANNKKIILLYPGGGLLPIRAWPRDFFSHIGKYFTENGYVVAIIGMGSDKELAESIIKECEHINCINLAGYTKTIRELLILFHFSSLLITNDGGPVHFASLTPLPTITFFGPETPLLYGSLSPNAYHFYTSLSCSPCLTAYNHRNSPCDGNNLCLQLIHPETVIAKAIEMIERTNG
ncbi:MAG: glycosyltransferase family 9 protein [Desulfobacterales bacterium]|nr:glycosyltransferase family 9 protein [Desulfobacterales bacterium]